MKRLLFAFLILSFAAQVLNAQRVYSRIKIDLSKYDLKDIAKLGLETDHGFVAPGIHFVNDLSDKELKLLRDNYVEYHVLVSDLKQDYLKRSQNQSTKRSTPNCEKSETTFDYETPENYTYGSMGGYHTFDELLVVLDSMHSKFPNLISERVGVDSIETWDGNKIFWVRLSDNPSVEEDEPQVLYTAIHHAREPNGLSQMIFYMWYLLENYDKDESIKRLVDNTEMLFIPCVNPDGYKYNEQTDPNGGGFWRKNRRPNADPKQVGVDLNRNYGYEWGHDDSGSDPSPFSDTYRGPEPFSEPETQAVRNFLLDRKVEVALNYHTFGNLLIHPWGFNDGKTEDDGVFKAIGKAMIAENNYKLGTGVETVGYIVNGDSDDYMYGEQGEKNKIYSMTPEAGPSFWPTQDQIDDLNKSCMLQNLVASYCLHNYYDVRVIDLVDKEKFRNGSFSLVLTRVGLKEGRVSTTLVSESEYLTFDNFMFDRELKLGESDTIEVNYLIDESVPSHTELMFTIKSDFGLLKSTSTQAFDYKDVITELLFEDTLTSLDNWVVNPNSATWGLTSDAYSPSTALTDSPSGNYLSSSNSSITMKEAIDLNDVDGAFLKFYAKWNLEPNYDYVLVQASVDGEEWTSLCGKYTIEGKMSHGTNDPLYGGLQADWVAEEIDLKDYLGGSVYIRFVLISDTYSEADGVYIDDVIIEGERVKLNSTKEISGEEVKIYPTVSQQIVNISISENVLELNPNVLVFDIQGRKVLQQRLRNATTGLRVEGLPSGIYFVEVNTKDGAIREKISVVQ